MNETGIGLSEILTFIGGVIAALAGSSLAHAMMTREEKRRFSLESSRQLFNNVHRLRTAACDVQHYKMVWATDTDEQKRSIYDGARSMLDRLGDVVAALRSDVFMLKLLHGAKVERLATAVEEMIDKSSIDGVPTRQGYDAFAKRLQGMGAIVFNEVAVLHKQLTSEFPES